MARSRDIRDAEAPIAGEAIDEQLAVAGLEDMKRLWSSWKQDNRQRKNGKFPRHG